jgi:uncharacterized protein (TIGR03437 family)
VSVSADGNTAIVGGPGDNNGAGATWVFTRSGGVWSQQGNRLVGTGAGGLAHQGDVALSADGNTAIVGGPFDNSSTGAAWVFTRSGGVWSQQGNKLVGTGAVGNAEQGVSVALSADGNTAIVGGYADNNRAGAVWVFARSGDVWTQQGSKLVGTGAVGNAEQGVSVALSADGNTSIVGGLSDNADLHGYGAGAVWVFTRSGGVWTQQGNKLVGTGAVGSIVSAEQGYSVALSGDGNTALVGGPFDDSPTGAVWVFTRSGGVWTQQGSKLVGSGAVGVPAQGSSVALSGDGNTALVGGSSDNSSTGATWVFARSGGVWSQQGSKLVGTGAVGLAHQGHSVALSGDGNTALVGGPSDNSSTGATWVFALPSTTSQAPEVSTSAATSITSSGAVLGGRVNPNGLDTHAWFSYSTNSSMNGAVSTPQQDIGSGTVTVPVSANIAGLAINTTYYFRAMAAQNSAEAAQGSILSFATATSAQPPTVSTSAATSITNSGAVLGGGVNPNGLDTHVWFLYSTNRSMNGAVSTPQQDIGSGTVAVPVSANIAGLTFNTTYYFQAVAQSSAASVQGSMLSFATATSAPPAFVQQSGKLVGTSAFPGATVEQGYSVALSADGDTAIVGGPWYASGIGAAWVYTRSVTVWAQQGSTLVGAGTGGNQSQQGCSVALSSDGNTAIVGGADFNTGSVGAWVYTRSRGVWTQQGSILTGTAGAGFLQCGASVALSADGNTAIVGAPGDSRNTGAGWVYTRSGGVWTQQGSKLVGTGAVGATYQGFSVALSSDGNTAILGGPNGDRTGPFGVGAAWVFTRSGGAWTQQGSKLVGTSAVGNANQGISVALSADGNTAIVGGPFDSSNAGAAWVYTRSGGAWTQQGGKLAGSAAVGNENQGSAVALSADGNTAIVGAPGDSRNIGGALVYTRSGDVWTQQGDKLVAFGVFGVQQGFSVALSADANTAILGGPWDNSGVGAAWAFAIPPVISSIASGGVVNGASFLPGIAPGTWITIKGTNLSITARSWTGSDFSGSNNLPTQLDGVSVTVNGKPAYLYFISPAQLNVLTPADAMQGSVPVQVTTAQGVSNVVSAGESALSPALFTFSPQGGRYVAAVRADGTYIGPQNLISGLATVPAKPGDTILLFGTGFGPTTPPSPIGQLINPAPLANPLTVRIGGVPAITQFAGIVSPGEYQFNVVVPDVSNGDNAVSIEIGGSSSQSNAFLTIQR